MSRLTELGDQLKAMGVTIGQKIQESSAFIQLQERYDSMQPPQQKITKIVSILVVVLLLLFVPLTSLMNSSALVSSFEDKRTLIRDLFKVYRESSSQTQVQIPPPMDGFRSSVNAILMGADLTQDQILGVIESSVEGKLIPQGMINYVAEVKLSKLNIKQITDIGVSLSNISESIKLKDLSMNAHAEDTRYYDVTFKFYTLRVPEPTPELPPEPEPKAKPKKKSTESDE